MPYNHGVYNQEQETSLTTPIQGTAGLQVIFGTAPIQLAADPAAAVNKPVVCYSFAECQQAMGYSDDFENFTIHASCLSYRSHARCSVRRYQGRCSECYERS